MLILNYDQVEEITITIDKSEQVKQLRLVQTSVNYIFSLIFSHQIPHQVKFSHGDTHINSQ